jgi:hypothetical protein
MMSSHLITQMAQLKVPKGQALTPRSLLFMKIWGVLN